MSGPCAQAFRFEEWLTDILWNELGQAYLSTFSMNLGKV